MTDRTKRRLRREPTLVDEVAPNLDVAGPLPVERAQIEAAAVEPPPASCDEPYPGVPDDALHPIGSSAPDVVPVPRDVLFGPDPGIQPGPLAPASTESEIHAGPLEPSHSGEIHPGPLHSAPESEIHVGPLEPAPSGDIQVGPLEPTWREDERPAAHPEVHLREEQRPAIATLASPPIVRRKKGWREQRWERRRRRIFFEEALGWVLVPVILVAGYLSVKGILAALGTTPTALIQGIQTALSSRS